MRVDVDEAGTYQASGHIEDALGRGAGEIADRGDTPAPHADIGRGRRGPRPVDYGPAAQEKIKAFTGASGDGGFRRGHSAL